MHILKDRAEAFPNSAMLISIEKINISLLNAPNGIALAPIDRRAAFVANLFTTKADRSESGTGGFEMNNRFCS